LKWCAELKIPQVSIYTLSTENLNRPKRELDELFKLFKKFLVKWLESGELDKYEIKVKFLGDFRKLPDDVVKLMKKIMKKTLKYDKIVLNFLVAYGSKFELTQAFKKVAEKIVKSGRIRITQKDIEKHLLVQTPVDLIIRTGGMSRLSNFLLWQSDYAEIYVTNTLWPDFSRAELIKAIRWFNGIQRNFGR
jgi:undecaprenyl diphosphate synthase